MKPTELDDYSKTIQQALNVLGKTDFVLILHGASFPSIPDEDTGIGSSMGRGAKKLVQFLKTLGFNGIQLGPEGKTKSIDASPYTSTSFSNNPLLIDLASLAKEPQWLGLLSPEVLNTVVTENPQKGSNRVAYRYIYGAQDKALKSVFEAYQERLQAAEASKLSLVDPIAIESLRKQFESFKTKNQNWLEKDALYEVLSEIHGNDYWPLWPNPLDQRLFNPQDEPEALAAQQRIAEIQTNNKRSFEYYQFCQFIADAQKRETQEFLTPLGFKTLADRQVAFSDRDVWAYQKLFLKGFSLGAPPDYFSENGQAWGFSVLDPTQIKNPEGSLGPAGKLLLALFEKIFRENRGGVRIDHIIGLIDPWVYPSRKTPKSSDGAGRLYSSPEHPQLAQFSKVAQEDLNFSMSADHEERVKSLTETQIDAYCDILNIVLQAARNQGLGKEALICEDLGTLTLPVQKALQKLELSGLRVTQFVDPAKPDHLYRGKNAKPPHWVMPGTHDNVPLIKWLKGIAENPETLQSHARCLTEDLLSDDVPEPDKTSFFQRLNQNKKALVQAKLAELFTSPARKIQVFFTDVFGLSQTYNKPGTAGDENWSLRLPNDYETQYYQAVEQGDGFNIPKALLVAFERQGQGFMSQHKALVDKLKSYTQILGSVDN